MFCLRALSRIFVGNLMPIGLRATFITSMRAAFGTIQIDVGIAKNRPSFCKSVFFECSIPADSSIESFPQALTL